MSQMSVREQKSSKSDERELSENKSSLERRPAGPNNTGKAKAVKCKVGVDPETTTLGFITDIRQHAMVSCESIGFSL